MTIEGPAASSAPLGDGTQPLVPKQTQAPELQESQAQANEQANNPQTSETAAPGRNKKKKKNKRGKGKSIAARGPTALPRGRGSGFEEYYADPPMTPSEAMEEKNDIYAEELSFEERIQSCIHRYRSRRRLQPQQTVYFNEYLFLGGIDTGTSIFSGQDPSELKDLTPAQRREAMAIDAVHGGSSAGERFYTGDRENWSVDFAGIAAGFFSIALMNLSGGEPEGIATGISLVENFLKYILHHDVCPEYEEDVKRAVRLCDTARCEWPMMMELRAMLPGQFNLAASEYFSQQEENDWFLQPGSRPEGFNPRAVFFTALALTEDGDVFDRVSEPGVKVLRQFSCTLRLEEIIRPSEVIVERFKRLCLDGSYSSIPPLGKILCTAATIEDGWDYPVVPSPLAPREKVTLYFDDEVLSHMKVGMKMAVTLCELDGGLRFVKTIRNVVPSFYTFLPQELMRHFKTPRADDRPAPSVNDPAAGDEESADDAKKAE